MYMKSYKLLLIIMEIGFCSNKRKRQKINVEGMIRAWDLMGKARHLSKHGHLQFLFIVIVFDELL